MPMKYIMTEDGPVIFPERMEHAQVAAMLDVKPDSAGFVHYDKSNGFYVSGRSVSLNLTHNGVQDEKWITQMMKP